MSHRCASPPRLLGNAFDVVADTTDGAAGSVWHLGPSERQLDANIIHLPAGDQIEPHDGGDLDVLILVLDGTGVAKTDETEMTLQSGTLLWLPRLSHRSIVAGDKGLSYFTVHARRPALSIGPVHHA